MNRLKLKNKYTLVAITHNHWQALDQLSSDQYLILKCASVAAALEICLHQVPDCILLDGESVDLESVKPIHQLQPQVPFVMIGGSKDAVIELDYLAIDTLTKELLVYAIRSAIAQAQLKQQLELGIGINILTQIIHSTHELSSIFTAAITTISRLIHLNHVEVSQYLPDCKTWIPFAYNHDISSPLLFNNLSNNLISSHLLQGEILSINSTAAIASNICCLDDDNYEGSWLLVPLVVNSGVWGAVALNGREGNRCYWRDREIDLVSNVGVQLGIAIQQSLSHAQIATELADRRRIEIDLRQSEQLYATLAEASPVGIFRTDTVGNCLYVNERWCQIAGISADAAMGRGWIQGIYEGDRTFVATEWQKAITALPIRPFSLEYRFQAPTELIWVYGQTVAELGINGSIVGYVGTITDISARKQGELLLQKLNDSLELKINERTQALLESEAKFRCLIEGGGELIWSEDLDGVLTYLSPQFKTLFGWEPEMYLGKSFISLVHPEDVSKVKANLSQKIDFNQKKLAGIEFRHLCQDGSYIWVRSSPSLISNAEGKVVAVQGIVQDISDLKQIEAQLLASQKDLQQFFAMDLDLLCIADSEGHFLHLNQAWEGTLGYPLSELEGQLFLEFVHPDDILNTLEAIAQLEDRQHVARFVNRCRCKDGTYRYIEWHSRPFEDKIYASAHDITTQKEINDRLRMSEQNLHEAQRLAHVGSWEYNLITQKISWTLELFNIFGLDANRPEPSFQEYLQLIHPEDRAELERQVEQAINYGTAYEIEHRIIKADGSTRWILGRGEVEPNLQGKATRIFGTAFDITMLKEAAIALAQSTEAAEAGTQAKSEFLASMSHEIRTPMNGVLGMAELLAGTELNPDQQEFVQTIRESGDALLTIINDILDFSKIEAGMLELEERVFMLADIVKSVCHLLAKAASDKAIALTSIIHPQTPTTFLGDSARIRQILLNLVGNAIKFTKKGSVTINISISNVGTSDNSTVSLDRLEDEFKDGKSKCELLVAVTDSGIGIRSDRLSKLFQPFTQADAAISRKYGGTGLGLAISKRLAELMEGTIWVESFGNIGGNPPEHYYYHPKTSYTKGSTFYFTLKVTNESASEILKFTHLDHPAIAPPSPLRILLAEDNIVNQKVTIRILQRLGYSADIAANGLEVLKALTTQKYDLIIMDMQMPEMDGIETTQRICELYPISIRPYIIAMTANALPSDRQACLAAGMDDYISKPVRIEELLSVLKDVEIISLEKA